MNNQSDIQVYKAKQKEAIIKEFQLMDGPKELRYVKLIRKFGVCDSKIRKILKDAGLNGYSQNV